MQYVTAEKIGRLIANVKHGQFFSLVFERAEPKCLGCGKKSKKWLATKPVVCPHCGGLISYEREALAQTGVYRPANKAIAPKGVGETFAQKRAKGIVGFYDAQVGGYREARLENIKRLKCDGVEYGVLQ